MKKEMLLCAELTDADLQRLSAYCNIETAGYLETGFDNMSEDELLERGRGKEIVCVYIEKATERCIDAWVGCGLKLLGCGRGTPVNVDWKAVHKHNLPLIYTPGRNAVAVAEFTIGLILAQSRSIVNTAYDLRTGRYTGEPVDDIYAVPDRKDVVWAGRDGSSPNADYPDDFELYGRTLGIVGFGAIGRLLSKYACAFGMDVLAYDPYCSAEQVTAQGGKKVSLEELLAQSDIVSIHLPVTKETTGMIDAGVFAQMKDGAYFINTARAAVVDQKAFMDALTSGKLGGAALDVCWVEPIPENHPLLGMKNVTITPHIGGVTVDVPRWQSRMLAEDIINYCEGKPLQRVWTRVE